MPPTSPKQAVFDFEQLHVEAIALSLRHLATWAMHRLFEGERAPPLPEAERQLWQSLRQAARRHTWCSPVRGRDPGAHRSWARSRLCQAHCKSSRGLPDILLNLAASLAWSHPAFELDLSKTVRRRLKSQTIFQPEFEAHLGFASQTFHLLILIADATPNPKPSPPRSRLRRWGRRLNLPQRWRSRRHRKRHRAALDFLFNQAVPPILDRKHWAGFWDQWLLTEALLTLPEANRKNLIKRYPQLVRFPFLRHRLGLHPLRPHADPAPCHPDWTTHAPPGLLRLYGYHKRPPPLPAKTG